VKNTGYEVHHYAIFRHVQHMEKMRKAYKSIVRNPQTKRTLWRSRHRWKDNN